MLSLPRALHPLALLAVLLGLLAPSVHAIPYADFVPILDMLARRSTPLVTRVISARDDTVWLEPIEGVAVGDWFTFYAPGTVLTAESLPPEPHGALRITAVDHDSLKGLVTDGEAPPDFAAARRERIGGHCAVVWQLPEDQYAIAETAGLTGGLYAAIQHEYAISFTDAAPPGVAGHVPEPPSRNVIRDPDYVLLLKPGERGLDAVLLTAAGIAIDRTTLNLPGFGSPGVELFSSASGAVIPGRAGAGGTHYLLPREACDCAVTPSWVGPARLWCLTDAGLLGYEVTAEGLRGLGAIPLPLTHNATHRREPTGRIGIRQTASGWTLEAHPGGTVVGFALTMRGESWTVTAPLTAIPLHSAESTIFAAPDETLAGRYSLASAGLERPPDYSGRLAIPGAILDAVEGGGYLAVIDAEGQLILRNSEGAIVARDAGPYGPSLHLDGDTLYATLDQQVVRIQLYGEGRFLRHLDRSKSLGGNLSAIIGLDSPNGNLWALIQTPEGADELVSVARFDGENRRVTGSWNPLSDRAVRFGIPATKLRLTPSSATTALERQLLPALYDTPVVLLPDGQPRPHAALRLERNLASTRYLLTLHPALRWPDGTGVTAHAVLDGWRRTIREHALHAPAFALVDGANEYAAGDASDVSGLEVLDDQIIAITLRRAEPKFATYLADGAWGICRGAARTIGGASGSVEVMEGTGPYRATNPAGRVIDLARNDRHFEGIPYLKTWRLTFLGDAEGVARAYFNGQLDAAPLALSQRSMFLSDSGWSSDLVERPTSATIGFAINPRSTRLSTFAARRPVLALPDPTTLRQLTLAGAADPTRGHFAERLGTAAPPAIGRIAGNLGLVRLAVPLGEPDLKLIGERIAAEARARGIGQVMVIPIAPEGLATTGGWDVVLWPMNGGVQPVLAEGSEFARLWRSWGWTGTASGPDRLESQLAREGLWRPLLRPHVLWLRDPALRGFLNHTRLGPDWADAAWGS